MGIVYLPPTLTCLHAYMLTRQCVDNLPRDCATYVYIICPACATYVYIISPVRVPPMCVSPMCT